MPKESRRSSANSPNPPNSPLVPRRQQPDRARNPPASLAGHVVNLLGAESASDSDGGQLSNHQFIPPTVNSPQQQRRANARQHQVPRQQMLPPQQQHQLALPPPQQQQQLALPPPQQQQVPPPQQHQHQLALPPPQQQQQLALPPPQQQQQLALPPPQQQQVPPPQQHQQQLALPPPQQQQVPPPQQHQQQLALPPPQQQQVPPPQQHQQQLALPPPQQQQVPPPQQHQQQLALPPPQQQQVPPPQQHQQQVPLQHQEQIPQQHQMLPLQHQQQVPLLHQMPPPQQHQQQHQMPPPQLHQLQVPQQQLAFQPPQQQHNQDPQPIEALPLYHHQNQPDEFHGVDDDDDWDEQRARGFEGHIRRIITEALVTRQEFWNVSRNLSQSVETVRLQMDVLLQQHQLLSGLVRNQQQQQAPPQQDQGNRLIAYNTPIDDWNDLVRLNNEVANDEVLRTQLKSLLGKFGGSKEAEFIYRGLERLMSKQLGGNTTWTGASTIPGVVRNNFSSLNNIFDVLCDAIVSEDQFKHVKAKHVKAHVTSWLRHAPKPDVNNN